MPTEILMPALSPTMEEGTLAKWLVKEGDTVAAGDLLAEIETDKATMEFEAVDEGIVGRILVPEGSEGVKVNTPIAVLLEEGESADDIGITAASAPAEAVHPAGTPADTGEIGTKPNSGPENEGRCPRCGRRMRRGGCRKGMCMMSGGKDDGAKEEHAGTDAPNGLGANPAAAVAAPHAATSQARIFASPLARRIAAEKGIDLSQLKGSGPHGRIVKADVLAAAARPATAAAPAPAPAPAAPAPVGPSADMVARMYEGRDYEEIKLDGMRKTIAARLSEAKQTIPHFYLRRDIRLDALLKFRSQLNKQLEAKGVKLSVNDFIIKACANALQEVPDANAVWAGDRILKMKPSDVAVAVAIEGGLFTPVIRDAHQKTLSALSAEMKDLAARARERRLAPEEYQGGSFAISNLGMYGIDNFDAVINPPHGAILAVGAGVKKPVVGDDSELAVATVMSVTLSVDHRVIDGALGAELLQAIKSNLENPIAMLA